VAGPAILFVKRFAFFRRRGIGGRTQPEELASTARAASTAPATATPPAATPARRKHGSAVWFLCAKLRRNRHNEEQGGQKNNSGRLIGLKYIATGVVKPPDVL
jgi:hypothetical protein